MPLVVVSTTSLLSVMGTGVCTKMLIIGIQKLYDYEGVDPSKAAEDEWEPVNKCTEVDSNNITIQCRHEKFSRINESVVPENLKSLWPTYVENALAFYQSQSNTGNYLFKVELKFKTIAMTSWKLIYGNEEHGELVFRRVYSGWGSDPNQIKSWTPIEDRSPTDSVP